jgi:hypothetical protein
MRLDTSLLPSIALALLIVAGCHPVDEPGGLLEPLPPEQGLVAQANLDGSVTVGAPAEVVPDEPEATPTVETEPETPAILTLEPIEGGPAAETDGLSDGAAEQESAAEPLEADDDDSSAAALDAGDPVADAELHEQPAEEDALAEHAVAPPDQASPAVTPEPVVPTPIVAPTPLETPAPVAEPTPPPVAPEDLLPEPPASDADAIAALDRLDRAEAPPAPILVHDPDELSAPPQRCGQWLPLQAYRLDEYELVDVGRHGLVGFALLRDAEGVEHTVGVGDRLGPDGGKVTGIDRAGVVVSEIALDASGAAFIAVRTIRLLPE